MRSTTVLKLLFFLLMIPTLSFARQEFKPCNDAAQYICDSYPEYYMTGGSCKGGHRAVKQYVAAHYQPNPEWKNISGYCTVRFMVNCKQETGRHQFFAINKDLQPQSVPEALMTHVMTIVKGLKEWLPGKFNGAPADYFYHVTLKINNGRLEEVLP